MQQQLAFYSPDPKGRATGGFLYNQFLRQQLLRLGWKSQVVTSGDTEHPATMHIVDSLLAVDYMQSRTTADKTLFLYHLPPFAGQSVPEHWLQIEAQLIKQGRIVVTGTQCFELLIARHRITKTQLLQQVPIITPGISDDWQAKQAFAALPRQLLVLASVTPQKGIEAIVDVLTEVRQLDWVCTIYGETHQDPDFYHAMLSRIADHGLSERIRFAGTIAPEDVNQAMCHADLLIHFSQFETYSMVTAEAIATGLPVLSTPVGEMHEFARASNIRYLSSHAFTEQHLQLQKLLTDTASYRALCHARENCEPVATKSWENAAQQWLELINKEAVMQPDCHRQHSPQSVTLQGGM